VLVPDRDLDVDESIREADDRVDDQRPGEEDESDGQQNEISVSDQLDNRRLGSDKQEDEGVHQERGGVPGAEDAYLRLRAHRVLRAAVTDQQPGDDRRDDAAEPKPRHCVTEEVLGEQEAPVRQDERQGDLGHVVVEVDHHPVHRVAGHESDRHAAEDRDEDVDSELDEPHGVQERRRLRAGVHDDRQ